MHSRDAWVIENQITRRRSPEHQAAVDGHALSPGQHQIQVHPAVTGRAAGSAAGVGPGHLAVADRA
ncbi:MAG TPA: hypothetical protein VE571_02165 [Solirubrobacteraceae bacterium]|nr:hypothetical protein [Solirubrobacteraceae bacterium]